MPTSGPTRAPLTRLGLFLPIAPTVGRPGGGHPVAGLDAALAMAEAAERSGFDSLWVPDHPGAPSAAGDALEAYTLLGALAAKTTRVRLAAIGPSAIARGPGIVVKQVSALDVLSGGRAVLGLAPQPWISHTAEYSEQQAVAERAARFTEALEACRALLSEDDVTYDGHYYSLSGAVNRPRPVQPGGIAIVVPVSGADGDRAVIDAAVRHAGACVIGGDDGQLRATVDELRRRCGAQGRDPITLPVLHVGPVTTAERLGAVRALGVDGVIVVLDAQHPDAVERVGRDLRGVFG